MKNTNVTPLSQIYEKPLANGKIAIYTKVNNFKCGEIDFLSSIFYCVRRSHKNLMKIFSNSLGLNTELLTHFDFKFIFIPFENTLLKTYRLKWIAQGVLSPFNSSIVDSQILLPIHKINLDWENQRQQNELQLSLFGT